MKCHLLIVLVYGMVSMKFHRLFLSSKKEGCHEISMRFSYSGQLTFLFLACMFFSTTTKADLNLIPNIDQLESNTASSLQNMYTQYSSFITTNSPNTNPRCRDRRAVRSGFLFL